jgi:hypothetical protein
MAELLLHVDEALMERLRARAAQEQREIEEIALDALWTLDIRESELIDPDNFGLTLAQIAEHLNLRSGRDDVSENFDDILNSLPLDK